MDRGDILDARREIYGPRVRQLRRYALNSFIGLVSSADDDDGNVASGVTKPAPQQRALVEPDDFAQFEQTLKELSLKRPFTKKDKAELLRVYRMSSVECRAYLAQERPTVDAKIQGQAKEKIT